MNDPIFRPRKRAVSKHVLKRLVGCLHGTNGAIIVSVRLHCILRIVFKFWDSQKIEEMVITVNCYEKALKRLDSWTISNQLHSYISLYSLLQVRAPFRNLCLSLVVEELGSQIIHPKYILLISHEKFNWNNTMVLLPLPSQCANNENGAGSGRNSYFVP